MEEECVRVGQERESVGDTVHGARMEVQKACPGADSGSGVKATDGRLGALIWKHTIEGCTELSRPTTAEDRWDCCKTRTRS